MDAARAAGALTALGLVAVLATLWAFVRALRAPVAPATRLPAPWALVLPLVVLGLLAAARRVSPLQAVALRAAVLAECTRARRGAAEQRIAGLRADVAASRRLATSLARVRPGAWSRGAAMARAPLRGVARPGAGSRIPARHDERR